MPSTGLTRTKTGGRARAGVPVVPRAVARDHRAVSGPVPPRKDDRDRGKNEQAPRGHVLVALSPSRWKLSDGESLLVGRGTSCDVRIGAPVPGPEDLGVSRRAATLTFAAGQLWVRNDSSTQPLYVHPATRPPRLLDHRGETVSFSDQKLDIVVEGRVLTYQVSVEVMVATTGQEEEGPPTLSPATESRLPLLPRERRLVAALCEPLLTGMAPRSASYNQVAERLGLSRHTVRNQLDLLRARLAVLGVAGMVGQEAKEALAKCAVRSRSVTLTDLGALSVSPQKSERTVP